MNNNFTSIGEKIKSIRKQHKLTQIEFAQGLEISQGTLSEIESGKAKPSVDVLVLLLRFLFGSLDIKIEFINN